MSERRYWLVTEEAQDAAPWDRCQICEHPRSDHVDGVGCVGEACWRYFEEGQHRFRRDRSAPRWVEIGRRRIDYKGLLGATATGEGDA